MIIKIANFESLFEKIKNPLYKLSVVLQKPRFPNSGSFSIENLIKINFITGKLVTLYECIAEANHNEVKLAEFGGFMMTSWRIRQA